MPLKMAALWGTSVSRRRRSGLLPFADRDASQRNLSLGHGAGTGQDGRYGALAAAGFSHQRDKAALRDGQGHIVQDGALLLVTKSDMLQRKGAVGRVAVFSPSSGSWAESSLKIFSAEAAPFMAMWK